MLATLTAAAGCCLILTLVSAHPHPHHQVFYPLQPAASPGVYYVPQVDAAHVTNVQRYAAPVVPQYVLLYPSGGHPNLLGGRAEGAEPTTSRPTIWNLFNFFQRPTTTTTEATPVVAEPADPVTDPPAPTPSKAAPTPAPTSSTTGEETTPKPASEGQGKPEKLMGSGSAVGPNPVLPAVVAAALEQLDSEGAAPHPPPPPAVAPGDGRHYVLVERPQFFGNYDLLRQQRFGDVLHFRNGFVKRPMKLEAASEPGAAALAFQREMVRRVEAKPAVHLGAAQQGVVVEADPPGKGVPGDDPPGPSVAQAKPQAIALAGVGGMAAAAPVATAVVGPGGLAVSAPTATAVAGGPNGPHPLSPPGLLSANKHVNKIPGKGHANVRYY